MTATLELVAMKSRAQNPSLQTALRRCKCSFETDRATNFKRHVAKCRARLIIIGLETELEQLRSGTRAAPNQIALANPVASTSAIAETTTIAAPTSSLPKVRIVGQECYAHFTLQSYSVFIRQPLTAIANFYRLLRQNCENRNVLIPNKRARFIPVHMLSGWELLDRKSTITDMAHAIANKISMAADTPAVKSATPVDAIARWTAYHDLICRETSHMSEVVMQLELIIFRERL